MDNEIEQHSVALVYADGPHTNVTVRHADIEQVRIVQYKGFRFAYDRTIERRNPTETMRVYIQSDILVVD